MVHGFQALRVVVSVREALAKEPMLRGVRQILNFEPSFPRNGNLGAALSDRALCPPLPPRPPTG
eukprot:4706536-Amphidinium_carterae.1